MHGAAFRVVYACKEFLHCYDCEYLCNGAPRSGCSEVLITRPSNLNNEAQLSVFSSG